MLDPELEVIIKPVHQPFLKILGLSIEDGEKIKLDLIQRAYEKKTSFIQSKDEFDVLERSFLLLECAIGVENLPTRDDLDTHAKELRAAMSSINIGYNKNNSRSDGLMHVIEKINAFCVTKPFFLGLGVAALGGIVSIIEGTLQSQENQDTERGYKLGVGLMTAGGILMASSIFKRKVEHENTSEAAQSMESMRTL